MSDANGICCFANGLLVGAARATTQSGAVTAHTKGMMQRYPPKRARHLMSLLADEARSARVLVKTPRRACQMPD